MFQLSGDGWISPPHLTYVGLYMVFVDWIIASPENTVVQVEIEFIILETDFGVLLVNILFLSSQASNKSKQMQQKRYETRLVINRTTFLQYEYTF